MSTSGVPGSPAPTTTVAAESQAINHLAWTTDPVHLGIGGVNLAKAVDALDPRTELARLTNGVTRAGGGIVTRPGLTQLLTGVAGQWHSLARLNDPQASNYTRFAGVGSVLVRGTTGVPATIDSGFSGKPLTFVPWQTEFSGESWMYVADSTKMRKASRTGSSIPIGLAKPTGTPVVTVLDSHVETILAFQAASWQSFFGYPPTGLRGGPASFPITITDVTSPNAVPGVKLAQTYTNVVGATTVPTYMVGMSRNFGAPVDLSKFAIDNTVIQDEDFIHMYFRLGEPLLIDEMRIYFVCSPFLPPPVAFNWSLPGMGYGNFSPSAYMLTIRPNDYTNALLALETTQDAADAVRTAAFLEAYADPVAAAVATVPSAEGPASPNVWAEFSSLILPAIRRGDCVAIGTAGQAGTDWSTITGVYITLQTTYAKAGTHTLELSIADLFFRGGSAPDTSEQDSFPYDYRITNYDLRTGAESNPSAEMTTFVGARKVGGVDALRQSVTVQPAAPYGDANIYQRAYRRGGVNNENWYGPVADNHVGGDGSLITDTTSDLTALATGTIPIDHDQPVTTSTAAGVAVYAQPVPILFGPMAGYLFGLGDPYRPGDIYWCKNGEPDHWPASNHTEVCPPSEVLQNGGIWAGQAFAFSLERLYGLQVNAFDGTVSGSPTDCAEGLAGRWAMAIGQGGLYFVSRDSVRVTQGGASKNIGDELRPLFRGEAKNGYNPIDFTKPNQIRLTLHGDDLWFGFADTTNCTVWWVLSLTNHTWRHVLFPVDTFGICSEPAALSSGTVALSLLLGGTDLAYQHAGLTDDGAAIQCHARTASTDFGQGREEKTLGDVIVWGNLYGATLTAQTFRNGERDAGTVQSVVGSAVYDRYLFDAFGVDPQHAQSLSVGLSWTGSGSGVPYIQRAGVAVAVQPDLSLKRATTWQPLNDSGEAYLTGCWIDCDTFGVTRTVVVEGLINGASVTVATLPVASTAGRRQWFSWPAVHVDMIRLRPTDTAGSWMLFGQGWLSRPEPPRLAAWDSGFETLGDTYYTGLDLECDTFGNAKIIHVEVDGVVVKTDTITALGRRYVHITLPWGRGHIYRFYTDDAGLGLLYSHKWLVEAEPGEQANWNEVFTIAGTRADKWCKGIVLECDTFGLNKSVTIEIDGVGVETLTVNTSGRKVVPLAFPQHLGRVFRVFPIDANPGRLYSRGWLFDEEPYQLTRFETQEIHHDYDEWHTLTYGQITYKSSADVTVFVFAYGQSGQSLGSDVYTLPACLTKGMFPLKPYGRKGVLYKYLLTSAAGFWLYREESWIETSGWSSGRVSKQHPFGNDDLDATRGMTSAEGAAARSGGMA